MRPEPLAQQQLSLRKVKRRMKVCTPCPLNAVIWPKRLCSMGNLDRIEMPLSLVHAGKRMMPRRMPVLSQDDVLERRRNAMNDLDDLVAVGNSERSTRTKIILNIDHDQRTRGTRLHHFARHLDCTIPPQLFDLRPARRLIRRESHRYARPATAEAVCRPEASPTFSQGWQCSVPCPAADAQSQRSTHALSSACFRAPREGSGSPPTESLPRPASRATHPQGAE